MFPEKTDLDVNLIVNPEPESGKMRVWLDDIREAPRVDHLTMEDLTWDHVVTTAQEAIALVETGKVTFISFDHDLGAPEAATGYDVAKYIEAQAAAGKIPPIEYALHSGNIVGRGNIDAAMKSAWRFWDGKAKESHG